ncbi:MAG: MoxR family ATPase [Acidobacteria bacterium]|nr:MoxR family ATPase [Acidobacteriota bacterium]
MTATNETKSGDLQIEEFATHFERIQSNIERIIRGKPETVKLALVCLLSEGHLLIEDVPGVGKTSLAKAIADSIDGSLGRIQFTPDLLPTDVTGVQIFNRSSNKFEFHPGAVFANLVLGDEINRASPKTQSALLEVMEEQQVTVDGIAHHVPDPFMVIATQNPIDQEGTYPLPEAQLDRFMMRIEIGYPDADAELEIIDQLHSRSNRPTLEPAITVDEYSRIVGIAENVYVAPTVREYIVSLVSSTRNIPQLRLGASPRGSVALIRATRSLAAAEGRTFVVPDDVKGLAKAVLTHRLLLTPAAELQGASVEALLENVIEQVPAPRKSS